MDHDKMSQTTSDIAVFHNASCISDEETVADIKLLVRIQL